jgi:hypothetical protein
MQNIKFNRVNGWTYKTSDNQFMVYNGGPNEWYSAKIDSELVEKHGYCSVAVDESSKMFHYSIKDAQNWVRNSYKVGA